MTLSTEQLYGILIGLGTFFGAFFSTKLWPFIAERWTHKEQRDDTALQQRLKDEAQARIDDAAAQTRRDATNERLATALEQISKALSEILTLSQQGIAQDTARELRQSELSQQVLLQTRSNGMAITDLSGQIQGLRGQLSTYMAMRDPERHGRRTADHQSSGGEG